MLCKISKSDCVYFLRKSGVGVLSTVDDAFAKAGRNYKFPSAFIIIEIWFVFYDYSYHVPYCVKKRNMGGH